MKFAARQLARLACALSLTAPLIPAQAAASPDATRAVVKAIEAKDCVAAVRELNQALAGGTAEALMLGGAMFEQGLCLKPNLERAVRLYMRAADLGGVGARARLTALYASPAAGPDKGAALWWALQAGLPLPAACIVAPGSRADAEAFAKVLTAWPAGQLDACVHVSGLLAVLDADFAIQAAEDAGDGVALDYQPAQGKLNVAYAQLQQEGKELRARITQAGGSMQMQGYANDPSADQLRAKQAEVARGELATQVERVARDALVRFPRPAQVDAGWRIRLRVDGMRSH